MAFTDLAEATAWVFDLQKYGIKFGLSSTLNLLKRLQVPFWEGQYIHVAGTNGKGSVAAMLSAILTRAGYPAALFTSPHLVDFRERYRLAEQEVAADRFLTLINQVRAAVDEGEPPTFFEFAAAMAFLYFFEEKATPIILETGMGGRLDATNIVHPKVAVITNIALDHQEFLGESLLAIAAEKAGIIKARAPLVTGARQRRVLELFARRCAELTVPMYVAGRDFRARGGPGGRFSYQGFYLHLDNLCVSLAGRHQYGNAALALATLELLTQAGWAISEEAIREGLGSTRWPGRLERVDQDPRVLLDGAHNSAAARTLAQRLKQTRQNGRLILVLGIMADKDIDGILARLLPLSETVIFTRPRYFRAAAPAELAARARTYNLEVREAPRVAEAVRQALALAGPQDQIVITGSLYTVGEAMEYFKGVGGGA